MKTLIEIVAVCAGVTWLALLGLVFLAMHAAKGDGTT